MQLSDEHYIFIAKTYLSLMSLSLICFMLTRSRLPDEYRLVQRGKSSGGFGLLCPACTPCAPVRDPDAAPSPAASSPKLTLASSVMDSESVRSNEPLLRRSR
uniref:Uncharacterized protein n=1 Tax=Anopheles merus TaxID=30066 RepID=A0A182UZE5_ANOME